MNKELFKADLQELINRYSIEQDSNTPDYLLAEYLIKCLDNYASIINGKDNWYGDKRWYE